VVKTTSSSLLKKLKSFLFWSEALGALRDKLDEQKEEEESMGDTNLCVMSGRLTADPALRFTPSGKAVGSFRIALNEVFGTGEARKEITTFVPVVVWGATAETVAEYLKKGSPVLITGPRRDRTYETKDGEKRYVSEVIAQRVQFLGPAPAKKEKDNIAAMDEMSMPQEMADGDIPF